MLVLISAIAGAARAEDEAAAAAQFERGLAEMLAGRYATGCPALAESFRLDPQPGALFTLAECEAKWGRIATAVTHYDEYLGLVGRMAPAERAKQGERPEVAARRRAEIGPEVPELTLVLPRSAPAGTRVRRDGVALGAASLAVPLPVDPGDHTITTQAPGGPERIRKLSVERGAHIRIELEVAPAPATVSEAPPDMPPRTSRRGWAYLAGGIGVAGLGTGIVTGALAIGAKGDVTRWCNGDVCNHDGVLAADRGRTLALVSTIGFGVAIVGAAVAVVILATEPAGTKVSLRH